MSNMVENILPEGWVEKKFGEVCKVINGRAYKKTELLSEGKYKVLRVGNLFTNNSWYWSDLELKEDKYISNGDLIYAWSASFGPRVWDGEKVIYHYHIWKIVNGIEVSKDFLYNWLDWKTETIKKENTSGATMIHVTKGMMESLVIQFPDIEEQKRIVSKIDNLFAKIDKAIALTEESLVQAKNLLPSVLKEVFENCEGSIMRLNEVSVIQPKKNEVKDLDCEVSFVPMKFLNKKKFDFTPESDKNIFDVYKGYTYFQDSDVLLAKVIPCFQNGKSGVAKGLTNGIGFGSSEFIVFRPYDFILSEWLYYNISSPDFLSEGNNNMSGAVGLKRLIKSFVTEWEIKVPDLKTQKKYIDRINKVSHQSKQTQSKLEEQLAYLKQLKSSILSKAFKGEL